MIMTSAEEEDIEARSMHRYFQKLLDQSFWASVKRDNIDEPLLLDELRNEAALRAWVRQLDTRQQPPQLLPDEQALKGIGRDLDWKYGIDEWWDWAVWSTCPRCIQYEATECQECQELVKFTELCDAAASSTRLSLC